MINQLYTCPRCNYTAKTKHSIRQHLIFKKKPCPAFLNDIEISDDIIKHILKNRVYKIDSKQELKNTANNNNKKTSDTINIADTMQVAETMNNNNDNSTNTQNIINMFLAQPVSDQVSQYHEIMGVPTIPISDLVSDMFKTERENMDNLIGDYSFTIEDFLQTIDKCTQVKDNKKFSDLAFFHNDESNKSLCYHEHEIIHPAWEDFSNISLATDRLLQIVQNQYWNNYEIYSIILAENAYSTDSDKYSTIMENILLYYKFIACFDALKPVVETLQNDDGIFNSNESRHIYSNTIREKYCQKFALQKKQHSHCCIPMQREYIEYIVKNNGSKSYRNFITELTSVFLKDPVKVKKILAKQL